MADILEITPAEVRVGIGYTYSAPVVEIMPYVAIDVGAYDSLQLTLYSTLFEPSGASPSATVEVWMGMHTDSTDGWISGWQIVISAAGTMTTGQFARGGFFRYMTWRASSWNNMNAFGFCIRGVGRRRMNAAP